MLKQWVYLLLGLVVIRSSSAVWQTLAKPVYKTSLSRSYLAMLKQWVYLLSGLVVIRSPCALWQTLAKPVYKTSLCIKVLPCHAKTMGLSSKAASCSKGMTI